MDKICKYRDSGLIFYFTIELDRRVPREAEFSFLPTLSQGKHAIIDILIFHIFFVSDI